MARSSNSSSFRPPVGSVLPSSSAPPPIPNRQEQLNDLYEYNHPDVNVNDSTSASGTSQSEQDAFNNAYEVLKDYPEWLAMLRANPYAGFNVPKSFFDKLGLSNKAQDKLNAYQQAYKDYIAQLLVKFYAWKNSLPETQRKQLNEAGYNADAVDVQSSSLAPDSIQTADPSAIESDSSADNIMKVVGTALSTMSSIVSAGTQVAMTRGNLEALQITNDKIRSDTEAQNLKNYMSAYDIAKTLFSETADVPSSEAGDDITPSSKFDLKNAPESVVNLLNQFQHSRGFKTGQNKSIKEEKESDTGVIESDIENVQTKVLYGNRDTWQNLRELYAEGTKLQLENVNSYLELYDPLLSAEYQNEYNGYMKSFYSVLDGATAGAAQNDYVTNLRKSLAANKLAIECKLKMIKIRSQMIDSLFQYATDGNWLERNAAKGALMACDIASDYFGVAQPSANQSVTGITTSPSALQIPQLPSL